ncbi:MAG: hemerythrin domain-containing protein [Gemmataceae bacterium]|nr:hemerythrin domain-containing protein [Gemmataceae bacterium]
MQATEILKNEHRVIEQVLDCLERMSNRALAAGRLDGASARQALDFFRHFADGCHHGKEEKHLFPMMEARGFPREGGPTGVMLHEHDLGRRHIAAMTDALTGADAGDARAVGEFARHALAYVQLLREHIWKEDNRLFPMADRVLLGEAQESLLRSFANVESHDMGAGTHDKYLQLADELADRFGVRHAYATPPLTLPSPPSEGGEGRVRGCGPHACGCPRG